MARRGYCRLALSLASAVLIVLVITGAGAAHYVYGQGYIYKDTWHCTWARAELSHGSGGGYTKISVGGVPAVRGACVNWNLASAKLYYVGEARVRHELWKRQSNGSWTRCRSSSWKYNPYPIGANSAGWVPTYDHSISYGTTPPCGGGTYGVTGYAQVYDSGAWRGGKIEGGQHAFVAAPPAPTPTRPAPTSSHPPRIDTIGPLRDGGVIERVNPDGSVVGGDPAIVQVDYSDPDGCSGMRWVTGVTNQWTGVLADVTRPGLAILPIGGTCTGTDGRNTVFVICYVPGVWTFAAMLVDRSGLRSSAALTQFTCK